MRFRGRLAVPIWLPRAGLCYGQDSFLFWCCSRVAWPSVISLRAPSADPASLLSGNLEHMQNRLPPGGGGMDANPYSSYRKNVAICPRGHRAPFFQYNLFSAFRNKGKGMAQKYWVLMGLDAVQRKPSTTKWCNNTKPQRTQEEKPEHL